jgi:hypothetical protein
LYVAENIHEENKILGIHAFQNGLSSASCPWPKHTRNLYKVQNSDSTSYDFILRSAEVVIK